MAARLAAALVVAGATTALAQAPPPPPPAGQAVAASTPAAQADARLLPSPRLRVGTWLTLELTTKLQFDVPRFDPVVDPDDEAGVWRRRRVGIKGDLGRHVSFEIEREFGDDDDPWRDVYLNGKVSDLLEVRAGKFRVPFSLDASTGSTTHDFIFRSLAARTLAFGRDIGVMAHGRTDGRRLTYAIGVFEHADDAAADVFFDDDNEGQTQSRTIGGRVTIQPFDAMRSLPRGLRNLEFGLNAAHETLPEGLNGLRGRSVFRYDYFDRVYVKGARLRGGADVALYAGPASVKAEWIEVRDERQRQGLGDVDLPDAFGRGWYVAGTVLLTGEEKNDEVRPRRPLFRRGAGAFELAVRQERLGFGSVDDAGQPAFANPRAANILRNRNDVLTLGLTWYLNRWVKLQGNAIRESFEDPARAPITGRASYWSYVSRVQFVL
jgi:phosphate-selective porin